MNPRRGEGQVDQEVDIEHGIEMGMKQGALGHAVNDLPEIRLFHAIAGQMEHDARVEDLICLMGRIGVQVLGPDSLPLTVADFGDDATCLSGNGGEGFAKIGIWTR